jgi:hypothetical protein
MANSNQAQAITATNTMTAATSAASRFLTVAQQMRRKQEQQLSSNASNTSSVGEAENEKENRTASEAQQQQQTEEDQPPLSALAALSSVTPLQAAVIAEQLTGKRRNSNTGQHALQTQAAAGQNNNYNGGIRLQHRPAKRAATLQLPLPLSTMAELKQMVQQQQQEANSNRMSINSGAETSNPASNAVTPTSLSMLQNRPSARLSFGLAALTVSQLQSIRAQAKKASSSNNSSQAQSEAPTR